MKRASQHRQDRMSASLHLVDESSARRFGDTEPRRLKGLVMQPEREGGEGRREAERVKRVRLMRRAAARRRRILTGSLLVATMGLGFLSYAASLSPLFCLIPLALLAVVLVAGARAAAQARRWEARLAERQRRQHAHRPHPQAPSEHVAAADPAKVEGQTTDAMSQQDIKAAILQARQAQVQALAARSDERREEAPTAGGDAQVKSVQSVRPPLEPTGDHADDSEQAKSGNPALGHQNQPLLSFSMGRPRQGIPPKQAEPLSREIQSTKQVSKAVPRPEAVKAAAAQSADERTDKADGRNDVVDRQARYGASNPTAGARRPATGTKGGRPSDFHRREIQADVEAPELSEDSLGKVGVEAILARRSKA
ncbi:hypothetical protein [Bifidobacterium xylocopae]|uniref:Uncharacterized protein n=1 Tax=Bifidobacterium xylocopae TaxID=2493119 RepID=A0A366KCB7_9BIFI|nr:hypothetical protein [Bifidobacterium xylocopae]RBP99370.1 hypothetical protein CRD59_03985 [Bifidobacterium xylocopae]